MEDYRRPRVHKACDACGRRKVRCNGQQRCQQCEHLGLVCTYTDNRLARSRKHSLRRGEIISKHKTESSLNPLLAPALSSASASYFESLVSEYMRFVYPFNPIMTADEVHDAISKMDSDRENAAFVYAFAAATIDLTQSNRPTSSASTQVTQLINQSIEIQPPMFLGFRPSILRTMTNIFIQMCFMSLGQYDLGFVYLREAIAMIHLLRIEDKTVLGSLHPTERARRQRLYWLCFIHERFISIVHFSPATLSPHDSFPEADPNLPPGISQGWTQVIKTFLILEPTFINFWIGDRSQVSAKWVEQKHRELDDARWELEVSMLSETQQADLVITRQWMRTLLWQMAMSNCLLSSRPLCPSLSLELPLRLSSQLRQFLTKISQNTIRVHGSSILTKLIEIINTIADVVIHLPQTSLDVTTSRIGDIVFMKGVVFSFHNFQQVSKDILIEKFGLIRDRFPGIEAACELTA
ncbi:hypothetical protein BDV32DRAFT_121253 [Aspergillus pseudonomiae]|uniref:Uncharacterized protein n=1 Tax=Aspergillus pseudonomiae TaxID=1506151 RepID=A0A5N7DKD7_9EURO|nr:uncharacterized protein BDV37DRAFT_280508 [Aspergillus pseudonomiae]KAB8261664.1 hypothetical protein BDV32DRAFT_121253 [Aspergillus pseudonomiae]KAE8406902.1 hypothetical protein BDV37DRAFT_280508 [Aspergillus pseudonomiae]